MQYPSRSDYLNTIRYPELAFRKKHPFGQFEQDLDSSLVTGKAIEKVSPMGMKTLWSASGSCAIVFKYQTISPSKVWAIRCFYRSSFEVIKQYQKALKHLDNSPCRQYFVDCFFLEEGIRVGGKCYPLLKMEWVEGENLKKYLKRHLNQKSRLLELANAFLTLSQDLHQAGIAHGDLQHGNPMIQAQSSALSLKLIDYDSLYFSQETYQFEDSIKGLSDYQHPLRQQVEKRCLAIDFFPQLIIYLSILALAENPRLWQLYDLDEREGLLFKNTDFEHPHSAEIYKSLSHFPEPIATLVRKLKTVCQVSRFEQIPSLTQFLSDEPIAISSEITVFQKAQSSLTSFTRIPQQLNYDTLILPYLQHLKTQWEVQQEKLHQLLKYLDEYYQHSASSFSLKFNADSLKNLQGIKTQWYLQQDKLYHLLEQLYDHHLSSWQSLPLKLSQDSIQQIQDFKTQWDIQKQKTQTLWEYLYQQKISSLQTLPNHLHQESSRQIQTLKNQWQSQMEKTHSLLEKLYQQNMTSLHNLSHHLHQESLHQIQSLKEHWDSQLDKGEQFIEELTEKIQTFQTLSRQFAHEIRQQLKPSSSSLKQLPSSSSQEQSSFEIMQRQVTQEMKEQIKAIRKQVHTPTWTTEEILTLNCSLNWCYQQLYQFPHHFREGKEYFRDYQGQIHWTKIGVYQLKKLSLLSSNPLKK